MSQRGARLRDPLAPHNDAPQIHFGQVSNSTSSHSRDALRSSFANSLEAAIAPAGRKKSRQGARNGTLVTYRDLARMTILNRLEDLEKLSDSLYHPLSIKPLHRMRIAASVPGSLRSPAVQ